METRLTTTRPRVMLIATHGLFLPNSQDTDPEIPDSAFNRSAPFARFSRAREQNPMMRSGLALAGANTWLSGGNLPQTAGKGFVLAQDIAALDLWANELTVLSACDTARGDIKIGEGVFGMRRAFAIAGTKTLVMSLWKFPDKATALLMNRFFDNLNHGIGRGQALLKAQNFIRNITGEELRQSDLEREVLAEFLVIPELSPETSISCQKSDKPLNHPFYWGAWICQGNITALDISQN